MLYEKSSSIATCPDLIILLFHLFLAFHLESRQKADSSINIFRTQPNTLFQEEDDESEDEDSHVIVGGNKKPEADEPGSKRAKFT